MTFRSQAKSYNHMPSAAPIRLFVHASFILAALASAQSVPNTQSKPSASVQPASTPAATPPTIATTLTPSQQQPKHAQITCANGILSVSADNASLNQILHQISHDTGMKITGGVVDERVFGQYGPAPTSQILAALLDGTGSNMLFLAPNGDTPAELILTPRQGGPTPPNPNASTAEDKPSDSEDSPFQPQVTRPESEGPPARNKPFPPVTPSTYPSPAPLEGAQPDSTNGVKTPQQIYDQLQRQRQQQLTPPQ
jgi:hypothetical protein